MSHLFHQGEYEAPYCEVCGEEHATMSTSYVGACDSCAENMLRIALQPLMGQVCGNISRRVNGFITTCLAPYGVEHNHN